MELGNTRLQNFVGRIKLRRSDKAKHANQIQNLVRELQMHVREHPRLRVDRVIQAGSWKKGTSLRPRAGRPLDIDLVFFLDVRESTHGDLATLHDLLVEFLLSAYPTKAEEDFRSQRKTVGLVFRGSGLEADLVPVVPLEGRPGYVWQPERGGGGDFLTSVDEQLEFVRDLKAADPNFTSIVRIAKCWRNYQELELSSFAIELFQAHLQLTRGPCASIEQGVIRLFDLLAGESRPMIGFQGGLGHVSSNHSVGHLSDPTNNANNALARMTPTEWAEVVEKAEEAFDTLNYAQSIGSTGRTLAAWREVFGPIFSIEREE